MRLQTGVLALLITCASFSQSKPEHFNFHSQVGVVDASAERKLCLNISNPNLSAGTPVSLILPHQPQRAAQAIVEKKLASSCSHDPTTNTDASFYSLKLLGKGVDLSEPMPPAIAVVRSATPVLLKHGVASADLDGDGRTEFFRICTSNEGNHLTVWSGMPLQGKRRWHSYYYLGYDVVPNCKRKDYQ
jgi:hypothetical protein